MKSWPRLLVFTAVLLAACDKNPVQPEPRPQRTAPLVAGVFLGPNGSNADYIGLDFKAFHELTGTTPRLVKSFHNMSTEFDPSAWSGRIITQITERGALNLVTIGYEWPGAPSTHRLQAVAAGAADSFFVRMARGLAQYPYPILLQPASEMNGNWGFPWQGVYNGSGPEAASAYRDAWRRVHAIFQREGATNVRWVFAPNVGNPVAGGGSQSAHWNWYGHYYPGDEFVDYVALHGFNAPLLWGNPWLEFDELFDGTHGDFALSDMIQRFPSKPILIAEFASEEHPTRSKAAWIRRAYAHMKAEPRIWGAVWFHYNKETDWRINSSPEALQAYLESALTPEPTAFMPGGGRGGDDTALMPTHR